LRLCSNQEAAAKAARDELTAAQAKLESQQEQHARERMSVLRELDEAKEAQHEADARAEFLSAKTESLLAQIDTMQAANADLMAAVSDLKERLAISVAAQQEIPVLQAAVSTRDTRLSELQLALESAEQERVESIATLTSERLLRSSAEGRLRDTEALLVSQQSDSAASRARLIETEQERDLLRQRLAAVQSELATCSAAGAALRTELNKALLARSTLERDLQTSCHTAAEKVQSIQADLARSHADTETMRHHLEQAQMDLKIAARLQDENAKLNEELIEQTKLAQELETECDELRADLATASEDLAVCFGNTFVIRMCFVRGSDQVLRCRDSKEL
jgi:chromosome segregation ATPase